MEINDDADVYNEFPYLLQPLSEKEKNQLKAYNEHLKKHAFAEAMSVKTSMYVAASLIWNAMNVWAEDCKDKDPKIVENNQELKLTTGQMGQLLSFLVAHPELIPIRRFILATAANITEMFYGNLPHVGDDSYDEQM